MYSTQPEESTIASLESLCVVTILILPLHALGDAAKIFDRTGAMQPDRLIQNVYLELFSWLQFQDLANSLGDNNLKFRRDFDSFHTLSPDTIYRGEIGMSIVR